MIFDRRLFWPALMQIMALISPFFYLRAALGHGPEAAVQGEALLSIVGFAAIGIDFSASTFLAKSQARLLRSGALLSILVGRLTIAGALLLVYLMLSTGNESGWQVLVSLAFMLVGIVFDPSWIYIGRGHLWISAAIGTFRFGVAALLTLAGLQPVLALAIAFICSSILFLSFAGVGIRAFGRISWGLCLRLARQYYKPTITEGVTAAYSRLDVALAAVLLPPSEALLYLVSRKLIIGLQSVAFSGARIFYLEREIQVLKTLKRALFQNTILMYFFGVPFSVVVAIHWFNIQLSYALVATIALLSMLLLMGYNKILLQFGCLYVHRRFWSDFMYSFASMFGFLLLLLLFMQLNARTAFCFAFARVFADVIYLAIAHAHRRH